MTGTDAARTWAAIYGVLNSEFHKPKWTWNVKRLEEITTRLTIAIIENRK